MIPMYQSTPFRRGSSLMRDVQATLLHFSFTDYQFTARNNEYLDPARYQCRGFSVLLDAIWKGTRIAWCPYCYVDNDAALMRGWIQGYPRKFGTVHQTRTFATGSVAFGTTRAR